MRKARKHYCYYCKDLIDSRISHVREAEAGATISGTGLGYYLCTRCGGGGENTKPGIFCPGTKLKPGETPHNVVYDMANKIVICLDCGHNNTYSMNSFSQNTFFHQPAFDSEVLSDDELPF